MNLRPDIEQLTLADVIQGDIKNGYSPNSTESETGYWVLGLGALTDAGLNPTEIKSVEFNDKVQSALLEPGDFLISRSNTPDKVGRSLRFKGEIKNCSYPDLMMRFRPNAQLIDASFLEYQLQSASVRAYLKSCAAGSSASMVKITKSTVANTPIQLPPRAEQTKIAQILSTWDKAIATTERLLANSQQQKQALMQQLLTGQKRFAGFTGTWSHESFKSLVEINYGKSPKDIPKEGEIPIIGTGGVVGSTSIPLHSKPAVVIGRKGTIDKPVLVTTPFWAIDTAFYCCPKPKCDIQWFYYICKIINLKTYNEASGVPSLSRDTLYGITVKTPSLPEQQKIAQVLSTADAEIANLQAQLAKLKLEKKALMQQLLTGQRRVKLDAEAAA